ncbi:hypothetical protein BX070DRAFT_81813 [Coemansia spiralis]|nr:hypothetical protein BX070DRAFT_81813 [Coemansia spiralis]
MFYVVYFFVAVGLPLDNKPGYRCVLYIVDGTLLYDNGLGSEKLFSKGTLLMTTTNHEVSIYVRNPSKTHRAHIIRLWIDIDDFTPSNSRKNSHSNNTGAQQGIAVEPNRQQRSKKQGMTGIMHADFHSKVRHVADSDKENCLLVLAQPNNYYPSYGMTSIIYGPVKHTRRSDSDQADDRASDINKAERRDGIASLLGASYYHSKSALFTRPDYFTPDSMMDLTESIEAEDKDWEETDPQLSSRVCADPLLVDEDIFVSLCSLESGSKVIYEPYDLHDHERVSMRKRQNLQRATRRRVWIQTILADLNTEARSNGGRLIINGDRANRMRPGDSAYVRRIELTDKIVLENCGKTPIEFIVAETPY